MVVVNVLNKIESDGIIETDRRGRQSPSNETPDETIKSVIDHISSFPHYESHYEKSHYEKLI